MTIPTKMNQWTDIAIGSWWKRFHKVQNTYALSILVVWSWLDNPDEMGRHILLEQKPKHRKRRGSTCWCS